MKVTQQFVHIKMRHVIFLSLLNSNNSSSKIQIRVCGSHFNNPVADRIAEFHRRDYQKFFAEGREFADEFVVLTAVDAEERAAVEFRIGVAQLFLTSNADRMLGVMHGLGGDKVI